MAQTARLCIVRCCCGNISFDADAELSIEIDPRDILLDLIDNL
ncbi:hypothetical protein [Sodalis-like endosymbiont of Proechinophthirus fluctus]|nr:hypothetical protein [Sodalis-like endosymbiont of Proechinophthirus fluctus]